SSLAAGSCAPHELRTNAISGSLPRIGRQHEAAAKAEHSVRAALDPRDIALPARVGEHLDRRVRSPRGGHCAPPSGPSSHPPATQGARKLAKEIARFVALPHVPTST